VLASLGVTEASAGCEIRSSMDVVQVGTLDGGAAVMMDREAMRSDGIVVINRVKPHTKLSGEIESGLVKMCMIGLGKREGAATYHRAIERHSWMEIVRSVMEVVLAKSAVRFGLAIVQNAREEIARVEALSPAEFLSREAELLSEARSLTGRLPSDDIDLLIVDEMGKEISGTGIDAAVTGRKEGSPVRVGRIFVRDLTEETKGNAQGIGLADFTTRRLVEKIDFARLYLNSRTAYRTDTCKIPMTFETDREAVETALKMSGTGSPEELRLVWIRNTLSMETVAVSKAVLDGLSGEYASARGPFDAGFDAEGRLISPFA